MSKTQEGCYWCGKKPIAGNAWGWDICQDCLNELNADICRVERKRQREHRAREKVRGRVVSGNGVGGRARVGVLILLGSLGLATLISCRATPLPDPGPAPVADAELERLCGTCLAACEDLPGDEGCACAEDCEWARQAARVARADLREAQAVAAADGAELTQRLQVAHQERDQARQETEIARSERWDYFGWGVGAGAILTVILGVAWGLSGS